MATNSQAYPLGLLAGGMTDGFIHLWNPSKLLEQKSDALIASIEQHAGIINGFDIKRCSSLSKALLKSSYYLPVNDMIHQVELEDCNLILIENLLTY